MTNKNNKISNDNNHLLAGFLSLEDMKMLAEPTAETIDYIINRKPCETESKLTKMFEHRLQLHKTLK